MNQNPERLKTPETFKRLTGIDFTESGICIVSGNTKYSLKKYLPEGLKLEASSGFSISFMPKIIAPNPTILKYNPCENPSETILSILHEIGHIEYFNYHRFILKPKIMLPRIWKNFKTFLAEDKSSDAKGEVALSMMTLSHYKAISDSQQKIEREAWYYALTKAREIKKESGIDILSGFKDFSEIKEFIDFCLGTYIAGGTLEALDKAIDILKK